MSKDSSLLQIFNTFQTSLNIGVFHGIFVNSYVTRSLMRKPQQSFKAWRPTQRCKGAIHRGHFFPLKSSKLKPDPETIPLGVGALKSVLKIFCQGPMLWFFNIFAEKFGEKNGVFDSKHNYAKIWSWYCFMRKTPIFSPKIVKNCRKMWS
jgi:hypothetical protein